MGKHTDPTEISPTREMRMTEQSNDDRLGNVAPGDIISLELPGKNAGDGREYREYKVVHKDVVHQDVVHRDSVNSDPNPTIIVTLEGDDGETFDAELPADSVVRRTLESKWESAQSPTPHDGG